MAEKRVGVELTASFLECLDSIESFLAKADALKAKGMMALMSSDIGTLRD